MYTMVPQKEAGIFCAFGPVTPKNEGQKKMPETGISWYQDNNLGKNE